MNGSFSLGLSSEVALYWRLWWVFVLYSFGKPHISHIKEVVEGEESIEKCLIVLKQI